jgi:hypothetical protein
VTDRESDLDAYWSGYQVKRATKVNPYPRTGTADNGRPRTTPSQSADIRGAQMAMPAMAITAPSHRPQCPPVPDPDERREVGDADGQHEEAEGHDEGAILAPDVVALEARPCGDVGPEADEDPSGEQQQDAQDEEPQRPDPHDVAHRSPPSTAMLRWPSDPDQVAEVTNAVVAEPAHMADHDAEPDAIVAAPLTRPVPPDLAQLPEYRLVVKPPDSLLIPWQGRQLRVRHDDPHLGPNTPKGAVIRSAIELASDVEGLRLVLMTAVGDRYRIKGQRRWQRCGAVAEKRGCGAWSRDYSEATTASGVMT